jgi:hypothetical protein
MSKKSRDARRRASQAQKDEPKISATLDQLALAEPIIESPKIEEIVSPAPVPVVVDLFEPKDHKANLPQLWMRSLGRYCPGSPVCHPETQGTEPLWY